MVPENIHTSPTEGIGNSRGVGESRVQEIPEGGVSIIFCFFQTGFIIPICSIFVCLHFAPKPQTQK